MFLLLWGFVFGFKVSAFLLGEKLSYWIFDRKININRHHIYLYGIIIGVVTGIAILLLGMPKHNYSSEYWIYNVTMRYEIYSIVVLGIANIVSLASLFFIKNEINLLIVLALLFSLPSSTLFFLAYIVIKIGF